MTTKKAANEKKIDPLFNIFRNSNFKSMSDSAL